MRFASCACFFAAIALLACSAIATAEIPADKIVIIKALDIDGLAAFEGPVDETADSVYAFDGAMHHIDSSALASLSGVETLLIVDHRNDSVARGALVKKHWQEIKALADGKFDVEAVPEKEFEYELVVSRGGFELVGGTNQILCPGGDEGPYFIWKVESVSLVDRTAVQIH